jgi:hypothetical protein
MMLDLELLAYKLLTATMPEGITILPAHEVDEIDVMPLVLFSVSGGNAVDGSPSPPFAWDVTLNLSFYAATLDDAKALAGEGYDAVWSWDDPWAGKGIVEDLGHAAEITDTALPTRTVTVDVPGHSITQYDGSFGMQMHASRP